MSKCSELSFPAEQSGRLRSDIALVLCRILCCKMREFITFASVSGVARKSAVCKCTLPCASSRTDKFSFPRVTAYGQAHIVASRGSTSESIGLQPLTGGYFGRRVGPSSSAHLFFLVKFLLCYLFSFLLEFSADQRSKAGCSICIRW